MLQLEPTITLQKVFPCILLSARTENWENRVFCGSSKVGKDRKDWWWTQGLTYRHLHTSLNVLLYWKSWMTMLCLNRLHWLLNLRMNLVQEVRIQMFKMPYIIARSLECLQRTVTSCDAAFCSWPPSLASIWCTVWTRQSGISWG